MLTRAITASAEGQLSSWVTHLPTTECETRLTRLTAIREGFPSFFRLRRAKGYYDASQNYHFTLECLMWNRLIGRTNGEITTLDASHRQVSYAFAKNKIFENFLILMLMLLGILPLFLYAVSRWTPWIVIGTVTVVAVAFYYALFSQGRIKVDRLIRSQLLVAQTATEKSSIRL